MANNYLLNVVNTFSANPFKENTMSIFKVLSVTVILLASNVSIASLDSSAQIGVATELRSSQRDLLSDKKLYSLDREAKLLAEKNQALKEKEGLQDAKETASLEYYKATSIFDYKSPSEYKELSKEEYIKLSENNNSIKDYVFSDKLKEELSNKDFAKEIITGDKIDTKSIDMNNFASVIPQIPEPETYMMFLVGLMLLVLTHKKIKRNNFNSMHL